MVMFILEPSPYFNKENLRFSFINLQRNFQESYLFKNPPLILTKDLEIFLYKFTKELSRVLFILETCLILRKKIGDFPL